jgi:hypothetical protein
MTSTDCPATTGTWLFGSIYDSAGRQVPSSLCDNHGSCSEEHTDVFRDSGPLSAIWLPGAIEHARVSTLSLHAAGKEVKYTGIELPTPIHVVDMALDREGGLGLSVVVDKSIDLATLWVTRGNVLQWSSTASTFSVTGARLEARVPRNVIESCADACEVYLQLAHVWRDDEIFSLSEFKHKLL